MSGVIGQLVQVNPFSPLAGGRPEEGKQVEGSLPEGTAAVPKGTELNMSALAGSVCDEDGIKASPGVAGVCQTERGRGRVRLLGDLAQHSSRMGGSRCRRGGGCCQSQPQSKPQMWWAAHELAVHTDHRTGDWIPTFRAAVIMKGDHAFISLSTGLRHVSRYSANRDQYHNSLV